MKKLICFFLLICFSLHASLSVSERNEIFAQCELETRKSMRLLEEADEHFNKILNVHAREVCKNAIAASFAALATSGKKERAITAIVTIIAQFAVNACDHFWDGVDCVNDAKDHAKKADELQERLWRDR